MTDPADLDTYVEESISRLRNSWLATTWLENRKLTDATVRDYYLGYDPDRKAVVIPYLNAMNQIRGIRWRLLHGPTKYHQPKGDTSHLFHVKATNKPKVWLAEGEFDAMILAQCGFDAVGVPGAASFRPEWAYLFAYCDQVTVVFDGDEAGIEGTAKIVRELSPYVTKLRTVRLPEGNDVNDLYIADKRTLLDLVG